MNYRGNHINVDKEAFIRFFEFFARDWNDKYFETIIFQSFHHKKKVYSQNPPPYGVTESS